ncbi:Uncharacterized membrane protein YcaP, DUF421 family [Gracilibacillus orientalis]|uniref:Uncharacterized membrane protein YcaP, DUF421 family n=1 Tax=Gracilibacillus orientalis TaxID=334253 RepID=A0A1I4H236_9BACI|nr:DUF421 domain-containing protein [Gracilibacillus orientalis]SFL36338.1 Uncharacterized membrane protein YcaP, DUF421 family [Gracilibacillus orientalis]
MHYGSIFVETLFGFVMLFILAKVLGKTQIRQLTAFDFISALILGELVGNALYDDEVGIRDIGFAVLLWGGLLYLTEIITQRYKKSRGILEGRPSIVIHKGKLQREEMKKGKLDMNQLLHLLRSKDVFSIREVDYALLETDGTVSVLKKTAHQLPTRNDLNLPPEQIVLSFMLINDGEIIWDSLREIGKDENWIKEELKKQEIYSVKDVFYAEYEKGKNLYVQGY